jgi:MYXO-CTERM domain-containing protein
VYRNYLLGLQLLLCVIFCVILTVACGQISHDRDTTDLFVPKQLQQPIIGGNPDLRHPEVGALAINKTNFCTGTLIAQRVVLTAAHCVDAALGYAQKGTVQFRIDLPDAKEASGFVSHYFDFDPALFSNHPKWNGQVSNGGDIGVGILNQKISIAKPMPANFMPLNAHWIGRSPLFLGYGLIQSVPSAISANRKYAAEIPIVKMDSDRFTHGAVGRSVCHGDSGGPAIFQINGKMRVIGVNSYVNAPRAPGSNPARSTCSGTGISMRTDTFASFLQSILQQYGDGDETCKTNDECGLCGQCGNDNLCKLLPITLAIRHCQPCRSDADCAGGTCHRFAQGFRCLQTCTKDDCCPEDHYCSTLPVTNGSRSLCMPFINDCSPIACQHDRLCGPGEICENGACMPKPVARKAYLCKTCTQNSDCGDSEASCLGLEGHKRCVQPCSDGDFCPPSFSCIQPYPGTDKQCVPAQEICEIPCAFNSHCPTSQHCEDGVCRLTQGGQYADPCNPGDCREPFVCVETIRGHRCLQPCGVANGDPGSACIDGRNCNGSTKCYTLSTEARVCLNSCIIQLECYKQGGGFCNSGVCLCNNDRECVDGYVCNKNAQVIGACAPSSHKQVCPAPLQCRAFHGQSFCVEETAGTRSLGQSCDALNRCRDGLACLTTNDGNVCFERCEGGKPCSLGGTCISVENTPVCLCSEKQTCPQGRTCRYYLVQGIQQFGVCELQGTTSNCIASSECPPHHLCYRGTCISEQAAELIPESPAFEPSKPAELSAEYSAEYITELSAENTSEPTDVEIPSEVSSEMEQTLEPVAEVDAGTKGDVSAPLPEAIAEALPQPEGCACQASSPSHSAPLWLALLSLGLLALSFMRRRTHIAHIEYSTFPKTSTISDSTSRSCGELLSHEHLQKPLYVLGRSMQHRWGVMLVGVVLVVVICGFFACAGNQAEVCREDGDCAQALPRCVEGVCVECKGEGDCAKPMQCVNLRCVRVAEENKHTVEITAPERESSIDGQEYTSTEAVALEISPHDGGSREFVSELLDTESGLPELGDGGFDVDGEQHLPEADPPEPLVEMSPIDIPNPCAHSADPKCCLPRTLLRRWEAFSPSSSSLGNVRIAISPNGNYLASTNSDGHIVWLWDLSNQRIMHILLGHTADVQHVSFSPDSKLLASVSTDRTIRLWEVETGKDLEILKGHTSTIYTVEWSPDGKRLASAGDDYAIRIWLRDSDQYQLEHTLKAHTASVRKILFAKDGKLLYSASLDKTIRIWQVSDGSLLQTITEHKGAVYAIAISPDGSMLASCSDSTDRTVKIFSLPDAKLLNSWTAESSIMYDIAFSRDGKSLGVVSSGRRLRLWQTSDGKQLREIQVSSSAALSVVFHPDTKRVFTSSLDQHIKAWDLDNGKQLTALLSHFDRVVSVAISPDQKLIATASAAHPDIVLWDANTQKLAATLKGHTFGVREVAFSPDGQLLASAGTDRAVRIWNVRDGSNPHTIDAHRSIVGGVAFSPDGKLLASASWDGYIRISNSADASLAIEINAHSGAITSICFNRDGTLLASVSTDQTARVWMVPSGKLVREITGHSDWLLGCAFNHDSSILATTGWEREIKLWKMADGSLLRTLSGHTSVVRQVTFSPDGAKLASASYDQTARIWDISTGQILRSIYPRNQYVSSVQFSSDAKLLLTGTWDGNADIWDISELTPLLSIPAHNQAIHALALHPDGSLLASAGVDHTVKLWHKRDAKLMHTLKAHTRSVNVLAFNRDGSLLASAADDGLTIVWQTNNPTAPLRSFGGHLDHIASIAFNPDSTLLATASWDGSIKIHHIQSGKLVRTLLAHNQRVLSVAFHPQTSHIAAGLSSGEIAFWDLSDGKALKQLKSHSAGVTAIRFSGDGSALFSASHDKTLKLWNLSTNVVTRTLSGHTKSVHALALTDDERLLVSVSRDRTVRLWSPDNGRLLDLIPISNEEPNAIALNHRGSSLAAAFENGQISLWDMPIDRRIRSFYRFPIQVSACAFSHDEQYLIASSLTRQIRTYQRSNWQLLRTASNHTAAVRSIDINPKTAQMASGSDDNLIRISQISDNKTLASLKTHSGAINAVTFSPDGKSLASGSHDRSVIIWDLSTYSERYTLTKHTAPVSALAFSHDGKLLASGSQDRSIHIWEASNGQHLLSLDEHTDEISAIAFHPQKAILVSASRDQTLRIWDPTLAKSQLSIALPQMPMVTRFSPNGAWLAIAYHNGLIELRDSALYQTRLSLQYHGMPINALAWNPHSNILAIGDNSSWIYLFSCPQ